MKIAFPFKGHSVGGSHKSIILLHKELKKKNISSVFVVHNKKGVLCDLLNEENIDYLYLPILKLAGEKSKTYSIIFNIIRNFYKIKKFIKKNKITIVHGNDLGINITWSFPVLLSNCKFIWHQRQPFSLSKKYNIVKILSDYTLCNSNYVLSTSPKNINKIKFIPNLFDYQTNHNKIESKKWLRKKYSIDENILLIGYVGRVTKSKNITFIIETFSKLQKIHNQKIKLIISGPVDKLYNEILLTLINKLNMSKYIIFTNYSHEPLKILASLDIAIMSSLNEAFGRTLIESASQSTIFTASKSGGHIEIVNELGCGHLYKVNNQDDLLTSLQNILKSMNLNININNDYRNKFEKYYKNNNEQVKELINIYKL